jgi:HSP20 family molecular chaperone IbpA
MAEQAEHIARTERSEGTEHHAVPPANVYEASGQLSVAVPLPGVHREHVAVTLEPERLQVRADGKYPQVSQNYLRHDWHVGSWQLDLSLPRRVDPAGARATLNLGVLVVMAPISAAGSASSHPTVE